MPPKKRPRSSRAAAEAQAIARRNETRQQRERRLEADRVRQEIVRRNETPEETETRLEADSVRHEIVRRNETPEETETRLEAVRVRQEIVRRNETPEETESRLEERRIRRRTTGSFQMAGFNYDAATTDYSVFNVGAMTQECSHCSALKWRCEPPGMCCCNGKIHLSPLEPPPEVLESLMSGANETSKHFLKNIRKYNACFQMTSFGCSSLVNEPGFMPTFKVQGQVYHRIGSLQPLQNEQPKFLQLYFVGDEQTEAEQRCHQIPGVHEDIVLELQQFLRDNNSYVQSFKTALERMPTDEYKIVIRADRTPAGEHVRLFNAPTTDEVAAIIAGNEFEKRDIVIFKRNNQLQRVSETHRSYDALQYPLMFWQGEDGYNFLIKQVDPRTRMQTTKKVSAVQFYAYRLMVRAQSVNHILRCGQLCHQFVVDMYVKAESERLLYLRLNQKKLRADDYIHLRDAMQNEGNPRELGQMVILPSSFTGGPRYMHEYTQDAMCYVRNYGRPDLFITFTCNPKWQEITIELMEGQQQTDRHDLTARVFRQKLIQLMKALNKNHVFGKTRCWMYSIEWQKRGLPHAHILVWLENRIMPNQIDDVICAEIPDREQDPILFDIIVKNMIHGPCGILNPRSPCMKDGKCTKKYPRNLLEETQTGIDGYPLYKRRCPEHGGQVTEIRGFQVDNKWVVPYNPLLSRIFNAHINVEYCNSVKSIKYICKYVNKGSDQAVFELEREGSVNEIDRYQMGRYVSSNEAFWRILEFPIHERYPTVLHLSVHLENGQRVYFTEENLQQRVMEPPKTTLTEFFNLCQRDDFAKTLLYCDVPKYYTWDASRKMFNRRKQGHAVDGHPGIKATDALGRVYTVHPNSFECFFLRILLHTVRGPVSFEALRTFDGQVFNTFREACQRRGLLEDDGHWDSTMVEASATKSPARLRDLFAILLTTCGVSDPMALWESHKESLAEDILLQARRQNPSLDVAFTPAMFNEALIRIEDKVQEMVGKNIDCMGLPAPQRSSERLCTEILRETSYDIQQLTNFISENEPLLTQDQRKAMDDILTEVNRRHGCIFFLDAPGGTGKTFVLKLLLAKIREQSKIAVAVASSGIAATLLPGGRTAHSTFKLPFDLARTESPLCNIKKGTGNANLFKECQVIVWDECTMAHKNALEALDRTLQDIRSNCLIMGGVVVVLAGDFRQTLPIVPKGTMADEVKACLKSSNLWRHVRKLALTTNMRVHLHGDVSDAEFAEELLSIGNGSVQSRNGLIKIKESFCNIVQSVEELKARVFPNIREHFQSHKWLCERAILAPKNVSVNSINLQIQDQLPGESLSYKSIDTVVDENEAVHYPIEFLNSLDPPGMPPHNLKLKIGSSIMLLRNLNPPKLCNGTRLCVKRLMSHVIEATILTGCAKGEDAFIPRIPLIPSDMPFNFKRLQFPLRLAFAMSINKAQGQSLKQAGVNLDEHCFSHGQLYVACSRVGSGRSLYIFAPNGETKNVVYQAALR